MGAPEFPVDKDWLLNFTERHRTQQPNLILAMDWDGLHNIPTTIWNDGHTSPRFKITRHDFDLVKFGGDILFCGNSNRSLGTVSTFWEPSKASICISDMRGVNPIEAVRIQFSQLTWDARLYFPRSFNGSTGKYRTQDLLAGCGSNSFAPDQPYFSCLSRKGPLIWVVRRFTAPIHWGDTESTARLLLLDAYDRLVAMEDWEMGPWRRPTKPAMCHDNYWRPPSSRPNKGGQMKEQSVCYHQRQLKFYGSPSNLLVAEVLASYVVLSAQMRRYEGWRAAALKQAI